MFLSKETEHSGHHVRNVGKVLEQLGKSDHGEDRRAERGKEENGPASPAHVTQVMRHTH